MKHFCFSGNSWTSVSSQNLVTNGLQFQVKTGNSWAPVSSQKLLTSELQFQAKKLVIYGLQFQAKNW
jgi:hypothetical protein